MAQVKQPVNLALRFCPAGIQQRPTLRRRRLLISTGSTFQRLRVKDQLPDLIQNDFVQLRHRPPIIFTIRVPYHSLGGFCPGIANIIGPVFPILALAGVIAAGEVPSAAAPAPEDASQKMGAMKRRISFQAVRTIPLPLAGGQAGRSSIEGFFVDDRLMATQRSITERAG